MLIYWIYFLCTNPAFAIHMKFMAKLEQLHLVGWYGVASSAAIQLFSSNIFFYHFFIFRNIRIMPILPVKSTSSLTSSWLWPSSSSSRLSKNRGTIYHALKAQTSYIGKTANIISNQVFNILLNALLSQSYTHTRSKTKLDKVKKQKKAKGKLITYQNNHV